jgi:hypothetical protein
MTGRGVRVAVIDSGVHVGHPHIGPIAGGTSIGREGSFVDQLGHGTAVMAAIQEKAPDAEYFAVKVFHESLRTSTDSLLRAIEWSLENRMDVINLSLGTLKSDRAAEFEALIARGVKCGALLVSAREANGALCYPGSLEGVIGVNLDSECGREQYRADGARWFASGYPRPVPGVPPERNLNGISFAVANMTGFVARACEGLLDRSLASVSRALSNATPP